MGASSSDYSEWNIDDKWSSYVWKSGEMSNTGTGRLVSEQPAGSFMYRECILHLIFTNILRYTNGYGKLRTSSRTT